MKVNVVIFVVVAVLAVAGLVTGLVLHFTRGPEDAGMKERPGLMGSGNVKLVPGVLHVIGDGDLDEAVLAKAVAWWNAQPQPYRLTFEVDAARFQAESTKGVPARTAATMDLAELPTEEAGVTNLYYDKVTGRIIAADAIINHEHAYHPETYLGAVKHELGEVLGLADDPNPGLDLNSIMRLKLNPGGVLTAHDAALLRGE